MSHLSYTQNFFIYFVVIVAILLVSLNFIFAIHAPYKEKKTPFECGYHSFLQNRIQFVISFFVFALLFLLFDLEIVLIYPFSVSIDINFIYGLIFMIIFAIAVTSGFVFEFGKKALTIDSRQFNLKEVHMGIEPLLEAINQNFSSFSIYYKQAGGTFDNLIELNKLVSKQGLDHSGYQKSEQLRENLKYTVFMMKMNQSLLEELIHYYKGWSKLQFIHDLLDLKNNIKFMEDSDQFKNLDLGNTEIPNNLIEELKQVIALIATLPDVSWSEVLIEKLKPVFHEQTQGTISQLLTKGSSSGQLSGSSFGSGSGFGSGYDSGSAEASGSIAKSTTFGPGLGVKPPSPSPSEVATGTTPPKTFGNLPFR